MAPGVEGVARPDWEEGVTERERPYAEGMGGTSGAVWRKDEGGRLTDAPRDGRGVLRTVEGVRATVGVEAPPMDGRERRVGLGVVSVDVLCERRFVGDMDVRGLAGVAAVGVDLAGVPIALARRDARSFALIPAYLLARDPAVSGGGGMLAADGGRGLAVTLAMGRKSPL